MQHDLEKAMRVLVDKDEITDLVHLYSYYADHKFHDDLVALFIEDCAVDYGPSLPPVQGRAALRGLFGVGPGFVTTSHHNANVLISFQGDDRALVRTSCYAWHQTYESTTPRVWGAYYDDVVRTPEGWRFAKRQLRVSGSENWDRAWHPIAEAPKIAF